VQGTAEIVPSIAKDNHNDSMVINYSESEAIMFRPLRDEVRKVRFQSYLPAPPIQPTKKCSSHQKMRSMGVFWPFTAASCLCKVHVFALLALFGLSPP
jgi:hypothetical protein